MAGSVIPKEVKAELADLLMTGTWKVALLDNGFTYATGTHVNYTDVVGDELAAAGNYTTGGETMTGVARSYVDTTNVKIDADDAQWTTATFTARYACVYSTTAPYKIRAIYDFGGDKSVTGGTFTIQWNSSGLIKIS